MTKAVASQFVILLVEDEPSDAHLVRMAFAENKIQVDLRHVSDGVEAFEYLRCETEPCRDAPRPDLILLDLNMPRMDGREFLLEIKKQDSFRSIPVVVLTTSEVERDVAVSYYMYAAGYIVKPVDLDQFVNIIRCLYEYWCNTVMIAKK
ncbi:MAG: response regulator [Alphaproteobacteria bacterium]|nr:response regulator [Alphaproteobacteria bacterium]